MPHHGEAAGYTLPGPWHDDRLDQANPVQNTWYLVSDRPNVRVWSIVARVADVGETVELRVEIDGFTLNVPATALAAGTRYAVRRALASYADPLQFWAPAGQPIGSMCMLFGGCRAERIYIRKTTAAGNGNLQCTIKTQELEVAPEWEEIDWSQLAPVQNNWYEVFDLRNIRIEMIHTLVETTGETIESRYTDSDAAVWPADAVHAADTVYNVNNYDGMFTPGTRWMIHDANLWYPGFLVEMDELKMEIRKTTNLGAGTLRVKVWYNQY